MEANERITKIKIQMQREQPFFAYLLMNLRCSSTDEIETMGVDNLNNMYFNNTFVSKLTDSQLRGAMCHEVMHKAFGHTELKLNGRNHLLMNISQDIVINDVLINNGFDLSIEGVAQPNNHEMKINKYLLKDIDRKTAEAIYDELYEKFKDKIKQKGHYIIIQDKDMSDTLSRDNHTYNQGNNKDSNDTEKQKKEAEEWTRRVVEAFTYAKQIGKEPRGVGIHIEGLLNEKINWKSLLYKYITNSIPHDYTYNYPSKKSIASGFYMPSMRKEEIDIIVSLDTSGSINKEEMQEFLSEMTAISMSFSNVNMTAIVCDCDIKDVYEFNRITEADILNMKIRGGGGTSHKPVYKWLEENKPSTKLLINFTDGYTDFDNLQESVKTLWVLTKSGVNENSVPFGDVIKIE